ACPIELKQNARWGPCRQASAPPARQRPGARSARWLWAACTRKRRPSPRARSLGMRSRYRTRRPRLEVLDDRSTPTASILDDIPALLSADLGPTVGVGSLLRRAESEAVTLTLTANLDAGTRTWSATGVIDDGGTATTVWAHFGAINSPAVSI